MSHLRTLKKGKWHDQTFAVGELYVYTGIGAAVASPPAAGLIFRLTEIEHVVFGATPEQRYRFYFEPVLQFFPDAIKHVEHQYVTAEPHYMRRIDVLELCRARLSLDNLINVEAKPRV